MTAPAGQAAGVEHPAAPLGSKRAHREASERDKRARRFLLRLSLINWGIAVVAWSVSAFLGITSPASIIVYSVLFVIGLIAVVVALLTYLLEKFAHRPADIESTDLEPGGGESAVAATAAPAAAAAAAKAEPPAAPKAGSAEGKSSAPGAQGKPAAPAGEGGAADASRGEAAKSDGKSAAGGDAPAAPKG